MNAYRHTRYDQHGPYCEDEDSLSDHRESEHKPLLVASAALDIHSGNVGMDADKVGFDADDDILDDAQNVFLLKIAMYMQEIVYNDFMQLVMAKGAGLSSQRKNRSQRALARCSKFR